MVRTFNLSTEVVGQRQGDLCDQSSQYNEFQDTRATQETLSRKKNLGLEKPPLLGELGKRISCRPHGCDKSN